MLKNILLVGFGGFLGSIARYMTYLAVDKNFSSNWPIATLSVNILGSLILGFIYGLLVKSVFVSQDTRLFLAVGFCGSFTTFSSFAYENLQMLQQKDILTMISYTGVSMVFGVLAVYSGFLLGKMV